MTSRPARPTGPPTRRRGPLLRHVYGGLIRGLRLRQGRTLSEVERGLKEPSSEVLDAVCRALGSSITHLIGAAHRQLLDLTAEAAVAPVLDLTTRIEHQRVDQDALTPVTPPATGARASFVLAS
jgi:transcriptional regulator with XRE-family HTH domain